MKRKARRKLVARRHHEQKKRARENRRERTRPRVLYGQIIETNKNRVRNPETVKERFTRLFGEEANCA